MLVDIILYLLNIIQQLYKQNCWLIQFICRYIPLKQWAFDDSHSPKYQKFKIDQLPKIVYHKQDWFWKDLNRYYTWKYGKPVKPVNRRSECDIPKDCSCPACKAPQPYLYRNNGKAGQLICKICQTLFSPDENRFAKILTLKCPHCSHSLSRIKSRKHFVIHKCVNSDCPYYLRNFKKVDSADLKDAYGKNKYKLHYIYREFMVDFFKFDITSLPKKLLLLNLQNIILISCLYALHIALISVSLCVKHPRL